MITSFLALGLIVALINGRAEGCSIDRQSTSADPLAISFRQ